MTSPLPEPTGTAAQRWAVDYLRGRMAGTLDRSGRPVVGAAPRTWHSVAVLDDTGGHWATALGVLGPVRSWNSELQPEESRPGARSIGLEGFAQTIADADLVLLGMPKDRAQLRWMLRGIRDLAAPDALVVAAGAIKHMDPSFTAEARELFRRADVSPARGKARLIIAGDPSADPAAPPRRTPGGWSPPVNVQRNPTGGSSVHAVPGTFHGAGVDAGSRALLAALDREPPPVRSRIVELGSGNGWLAARLVLHFAPAHLRASDVSRLAVASTRETLAAAGVPESPSVTVVLEDALEGLRAEIAAGAPRVDLVVCNPPFHSGASVDLSAAQRMFDAAGEVLAPGGRAVIVHNSHLRHRPLLASAVGPVRQLSRDRRFTVIEASKPLSIP